MLNVAVKKNDHSANVFTGSNFFLFFIIHQFMKNTALLKQCNMLYKSTRQEVEEGIAELPDELTTIEWAFQVSMRAWLLIEKKTADYQFKNQQEEVYFYKALKPRFTGLIDYITLLYKSLVFQPEENVKRIAYWKYELSSCGKVIYWCKRGCMYYKEQYPDTDIYLLKHTTRQSQIFGININHFNFTAVSYSYLLTRLIAIRQYKKYIQQRYQVVLDPENESCDPKRSQL
jgi:hypothetical protein